MAEIGWNGATFLWIGADNGIEGISNFVFDDQQYYKSDELMELIHLFCSYPNKKHLFYNFAEFALIPDSFYKESSASAILDSQFPLSENDKVITDENGRIKNVYAVPKAIHEFIIQKNVSFVHAATCQLKEADGVYAIFYQNAVKVIVNQYGKLQFIQQFSFQNPQEAAYHLLNVCRCHELDVEEETILLAGMIDENSPLYKEISKFFNVQFALHENMKKSESLAAYPDHFFHHLISLAKCVS